VITKASTAGFLNGLGDYIQQNIQGNKKHDWARTARQAAWGFLIPGPFLHYFYGGLARMIPGNSVKAVASKIFLDQTICAPLIVTSFYWGTGLMEGKSVDDIKAKYYATFWPTMKLNYTIWPAAQLINFAFVPVPWQVVYVSGVSLVWSVILSSKNSAPATAEAH